MSCVLHVVAIYESGHLKIIDTRESESHPDDYKPVLSAEFSVKSRDADFLAAFNLSESPRHGPVKRFEVMSYDEYRHKMRAFKISSSPTEVSREEFYEFKDLAAPGNIIAEAKSGKCFVKKNPVQNNEPDLNLGTNCFMKGEKYFVKTVSLSDEQSWML